jgi:oligopeptide/dipeptide ABC transporter ATP-binding protein
MTPVLSVSNLTTHFHTADGVVRAVDDVSFEVAAGETLGIVGESGSGKSVTALSILRLIEQPPGWFGPKSRIELDGQNILELSSKELRKIRGAEISMVFQEPGTSLNPVLTVGYQVVETIRAHSKISRSEAWRQAVQLLETVGIPDAPLRARDYPHQMSGGMLQRVMIAIALSCKPKVLIADEPTTALDVTIQAQIVDLLIDLKKKFGMAIVFITHDLGVLARLADRVAVMYAGQIVEHGTAAQIYGEPGHPYTKGLLTAVPRVDKRRGELAGIPGSVPAATAWPAGCRFHPRCPSRLARCDQESPPPCVIGPGHTADCWLHTESNEP